MEQQILIENESHLDVQTVEQPLVSITEPIQTELVALSVEQDVKVIQEESAVLLVLTEGGSLYKNAVNNGFSGTELEWMTELLDSKASVQFVVTTMADGNTAYASALLALKAEVGSTYATNVHLSEVIAQRDLARALDKQILESKISSDIFASNQTLLETMAAGNLALSQRINTLTANLGGLGARVDTVEIAIVTEGSARAAAIQALNASLNGRINAEILTINEVIVNANESLANQITTLETNFNNRVTAELQTVNSAISNEAGARAAQISTLRADFTTGLTAALTSIDEVSVDVNGNALAISQLSGVVSNPSTGLSAAFNRANQAYTLADNTAGSLNTISGIVQHPTTGLAATYAFAQQVEINAASNTSTAINSLRNEITSPSAVWTANNLFIQSIETKADDSLELATSISNNLTSNINNAIANNTIILSLEDDVDGLTAAQTTLSSTVSTLDTWKTNTASVQLSTLMTDVGALESRAFFGVTSTTGGVATVAGLTINSIDYGIKFQGNKFQLTNTSGVQQLYYDTATNIWKFTGALVIGGYAINGEADIRGLDGTNGTNGADGTNGKSFAAAQLFNFRNNSTENFTFSGLTATPSLTHLNISGFNADPQLITTCSVNGTYYPLIVIRMRNNTGSAINNNWQIFYSTNIHSSSESFTKTQLVNLPADGKWYDVIFDMSNLSVGGNDYITSGIIGLRIDPPPGAGYSVDIESIFLGKEGAAVNGDLGAGFYGGVYSDINWTTATANSRFTALIGRAPVKFDIFTQTLSNNTDSQARQYNGTSWEAVALQVNGSIIAQGTIAGNKIISGTEISSPIVTGGRIRTAVTGSRTEVHDDGTYLIWTGDGAKTDANATFWIKKNGDGYVKGTFFQGQLMRRRFNSANLPSVTATGHITAGQPVRIDCVGYFRYQFTSASELEENAGLMNWVIKRNGVTIASGSRQISRIKRDPGGEPGVNWQNIDHVGLNILFVDNSPGSFGTNNSYTFEMTDFGYGSYSTSIATDENLIG